MNRHILGAVVTGVSVTMLFGHLFSAVAPVAYASSHVPITLTVQANPSTQRVNIQQVLVVDEDKFRLVGAGDFRGRTIRIVPQTGETLTARYDAAQQMFVTVDGKKVVPGIRYEVKADWARIPKDQALFVIPNLVEAKQVGPKQFGPSG